MTNVKVIVKKEQLRKALGGYNFPKIATYTDYGNNINLKDFPDEITLEIPRQQVDGYEELVEIKEFNEQTSEALQGLAEKKRKEILSIKSKLKRYRIYNVDDDHEEIDNGCLVELEPLGEE